MSNGHEDCYRMCMWRASEARRWGRLDEERYWLAAADRWIEAANETPVNVS